MKTISKVLAILLAMSMVLSLGVFAAEFPDVPATDSAYEAIDVLSDFGIVKGYEDGKYQPEKSVTRAEMTTLLMRMLNLSISGVAVTDTGFEDVSPDFWAAYDIKTAASQKIINGYGDGKFGPNDSVTYEQAVKMIVAMLGYETRAAANGGWPNGYLKVARDDLRMLSKTEMTQNAPAPRKIIAQLLFNALDVKIGDPENGEQTDDTLLKTYLKIDKLNGMVVSNSKTTLSDSESVVSDDEVMVEGKDGVLYRFKVGNYAEIKDMLGLDVVIYSKLDDNQVESTILHVAAKGKVETTVIDASFVEGFTKTTIQYTKEKDGKVLNLNLASSPRYIYNGKYISEKNLFDNGLQNITEGTIEVVNSGSGNSLVRINSYKNYVVKTVDAANNKIYVDSELSPESDGVLEVNVDDTINWNIVIKKNDSAITLSGIKKDNIISVKESAPCQNYGVMVMEIFVSDKKVSGKIVGEEDGIVTIATTAYEVAASLKAITSKASNIKYGANGTFYLDAFGKIANVVFGTTSSAVNGYLIKAVETGSVDSSGCIVKVMNAKTKKIENITLADNVVIDGVSKSAEKVLGILENAAKLTNMDKSFRETSDTDFSQPIQYITNASGKITDINTIIFDAENEKNDTFVLVDKFDEDGLEKGFKYNSTIFSMNGGNIKINSSTVIYLVPESRYEEKGYMIKNSSYFTNNEYYSIEAYDVNSSGVASVVVLYDKDVNSDVNYKSVTFVYNDKTTVSEDGETKTKVRGYDFVNGKEAEYIVENGVDVSMLEKGDIVRFGTNSDGEINENLYIYADVSEVSTGNFPGFATKTSQLSDYTNYPFRTVFMGQAYSNSYSVRNSLDRTSYYSWVLATPVDVNLDDTSPIITFTEAVPTDDEYDSDNDVASWKVSDSVKVFVYDGSLGDSNKLTYCADDDSKSSALLSIKEYDVVKSEKCDYIFTHGQGDTLKAIMIIKSL